MTEFQDEASHLEYVWTNTHGTANDGAFIDKIIKYKTIYYFCQPLNAKNSLRPRRADFLYEAVQNRIMLDWAEINSNLEAVKAVVAEGSIWKIPTDKIDELQPFWRNGYFSGDDAIVAYSFTKIHKPKLIIEIGVGNSTRFFRRAITETNLATNIVCVDPLPRADVVDIADEIIPTSVIDVDLTVFDRLSSGDFLFWDGSHVVANGSDVVRLFLEVLPRLKPGVIVHIHDISMPFEGTSIPPVGDVSYSEHYMLGTYLLSNLSAKVMMPVYMLVKSGHLKQFGRSFWFRVT